MPFPNSPLAASLPPGETEKRLQSFTVRRGQLNSNPSLYISKTRLSVRQLPLYVTDRTLKRLAIHAIRTFESEVSSGARTGLTTDELADATLSAAARPTRRGERPTAVCQTKVVRQMERVDPLTGAGRSRGYGFLEMRTFKDALRVLRWANANKAVASLMFQWWTEELGETADRLRALLGVASDEMANAKGEEQRKKPKRAPPVGPPPSAEERVELEARLKRIQKTLAELKAGAKVDKSERGGLILVEFSIENVTVTKKRSDRATAQREGAQKRKVCCDELYSFWCFCR